MKKINKKRVSVLFLSVICLTSLAGCGGKAADDTTTLNVVCLNEGYGREWIDDAVSIWESNNPGYKVNLNASSDAGSIIDGDIYKSGNTDDVYISVGSKWKRYAGGKRLLALDDLIEEEVDGVKIKDKINTEYKNSIYFEDRDKEVHTYRLPWTSGVGGIMYNAKMFEDNGWKIPETYTDLVNLCKTIIDARIPVDPTDPTSGTVYPFTYTGQNWDYFDYAVFTWWGQIVGVDKIAEFKNYTKDSMTQFDYKNNSVYAGLEQATEMWNNLFNNSSMKVADSEDVSRDNHTVQKNFMNGKAAMMINGDWCYNEMLNYSSTKTLPSSFELKIMNTPVADNAVDEHAAYTIGEDQYIAIPASTSKPELAKSFIKTLVSDEVINIFKEKAHGTMAYKVSTPSATNDSFMNSIADYRSASEGKTFTNYSSSLLFLNSFVDFWGEPSAGRPFESLIKKTTADVPEAFTRNYAAVSRSWDSWVSQCGM